MSLAGLRNFIRNVTVAFNGSHSVKEAISHWRKALRDLAHNARSLAKHFDEIKIRLGKNHMGREIAMLGNVEAIEFARLMRRAESVVAFERAAGRRLRAIERQAFRHLDDIAWAHFPDASILRRDNYVNNSIEALRNRLGHDIPSTWTPRNLDEKKLEALIRSDPATLNKANRVVTKASASRKVWYLGGTITLGAGVAFTIAGLAKMAKDLAEANTGCFMYTRENNKMRKCRVTGCSCPIGKIVDTSKRGPQPCREDEDMWDAMWITKSACRPAEENEGQKQQPYCVHCDWNETNRESVNYVNKSKLASDAYMRCEEQNALDAFYDITGNTVDGISGTIGEMGTMARDSFATSLTFAPWIVAIIVMIIAIALITVLWRFIRSESTMMSMV